MLIALISEAQLCAQRFHYAADQKLAANWYCTGISIEKLEQAILLGSVRISMSPCSTMNLHPIFACTTQPPVRGGRSAGISAAYWQYMAQKVNIAGRLPTCHLASTG
jgi:hypothetical protein